MTKGLLFAASFVCLALSPAQSRYAGVMRSVQSAPARDGARVHSVPSDSLTVILLGTGVGPVVNLQQFGASILVEAGNERFLFDCGRGATIRLTQVGIPIGSISRLFLTHLHSDHVIQIPDLVLTGWAGGRRMIPWRSGDQMVRAT